MLLFSNAALGLLCPAFYLKIVFYVVCIYESSIVKLKIIQLKNCYAYLLS